MTRPMRVATRGSSLARWQAEHVVALLRQLDPGLEAELHVVQTHGDRRRDVPIQELGGKGAFAKEVQAAVLDGRADIAVHSAKDLPSLTPEPLVIAAVPERGDPRDGLVGAALDDLPEGGVVATGSLRRQAQLAHLRPDLRFRGLRGNMQTRIEVAAGDEVDAVVVAATGLDRLGLADRIAQRLDVRAMVPQVAQAALAVECPADDDATRRLLAGIEHGPSRLVVDAERSFLAELGGDCSLPAAAHATLDDEGLRIEGVVASEDGAIVLRHREAGPAADGPALGRALARQLLDDQGGSKLLGRG